MGMLEGKAGLVTGAGRGIGRSIAQQMAAEGAKVLVSDIDADSAAETAALISAAGGEAESMVCDIADEAAVKRMVDTVVERWGKLDIACNSAALSRNEGPIHSFALEHFEQTVTYCLTGAMLCMKHEIAAMLPAGSGAIVNISSNASLRGQANNAPYAAAKSGVNTLTQSGAAEYSGKGIRINAVSPGVIHTPGLDKLFSENPKMAAILSKVAVMGRLGEPDEIAHAVVFLLSDRASFITGQILSVDGGAAIRG